MVNGKGGHIIHVEPPQVQDNPLHSLVSIVSPKRHLSYITYKQIFACKLVQTKPKLNWSRNLLSTTTVHMRPPYNIYPNRQYKSHARWCTFFLQKATLNFKTNYRKLLVLFLPHFFITTYHFFSKLELEFPFPYAFSLLSRVSQVSCSIDTLAFCPPPLALCQLEVASMPNGLCEPVSEKPPSGLNIVVELLRYFIFLDHCLLPQCLLFRIWSQFLRHLNLMCLHF